MRAAIGAVQRITESPYKGYAVTDGYNEMHIAAETRSKATGVFIQKYGSSVDWKQLRTRRYPSMDGDQAWSWDVGAFNTVSFWGAPVRLN